jgi:hypothetical protein
LRRERLAPVKPRDNQLNSIQRRWRPPTSTPNPAPFSRARDCAVVNRDAISVDVLERSHWQEVSAN